MKNTILIAGIGAALLLAVLTTIAAGAGREVSLLERRVHLLEQALQPSSPRLAANNWAEAVKTRNGAWQYALLSPALKAASLKEFEELNWVTGTSSPWVENYEVKRQTENNAGEIMYQIKFNWYTAEGYFGSSVAEIWVKSLGKGENRTWYISKIEYKEGKMDINTIAFDGGIGSFSQF